MHSNGILSVDHDYEHRAGPSTIHYSIFLYIHLFVIQDLRVGALREFQVYGRIPLPGTAGEIGDINRI